MRKVWLVDLDKCTGCETCVDICSVRKSGYFSEKTSNVRILKDEDGCTFVPLVCEHCRDHLCVDACTAEAIQYDKGLGIFNVDGKVCTGCGACEEACPYQGIFVSDGVARKCDLCGGEVPCVAACYPRALEYVEANVEVIETDHKNKIKKLNGIRSLCHE